MQTPDCALSDGLNLRAPRTGIRQYQAPEQKKREVSDFYLMVKGAALKSATRKSQGEERFFVRRGGLRMTDRELSQPRAAILWSRSWLRLDEE